jgi:AraC-like DNA-binding protein
MMFLSMDETAQYLKISRRTLNRKFKEVGFPVRYFHYGKPVVWIYDLIAYILYQDFYENLTKQQRQFVRESVDE